MTNTYSGFDPEGSVSFLAWMRRPDRAHELDALTALAVTEAAIAGKRAGASR